MYEGFFGLRAAPFQVTPDPTLLLLTEAHQEALAAIMYGIMARKGFVTVTGEVGVGKTTVLRHALDQLAADKTDVIYLVQPVSSPSELLRTLRSELAPEGAQLAETDDLGKVVADIHTQLLDRLEKGRSVVVAIDEAQTMPVEALESLRLLSNFETRTAKLLQVVLVGQPELDEMLARPNLRQLDQRIAVRARIPPLSWDDSRRYVEHRLAAVAGHTVDLFTPGALRLLLREAQGYPRRLNILCDNALMNAYGHDTRKVTSRIAKDALEPLIRRPPKRESSRHEPSWRDAPEREPHGRETMGREPMGREPLSHQPPRRRSSLTMAVAATGVAALAAVIALMPPWQDRVQQAVAAVWAFGQSAIEREEPRFSTLNTVTRAPLPQLPSASKDTAAAEPPAERTAASPAAPPAPATPAPPAANPPAEALAAIAPAAAPASKLGDRSKQLRVIGRGDTVTEICREIYGRCGPAEIKRIRDANPGIRDLSRVMVGQMVSFPVVSR